MLFVGSGAYSSTRDAEVGFTLAVIVLRAVDLTPREWAIV